MYMINLNKYEQEEFDSYTKESIYEAFVSETIARVKLEKQLKQSDRSLAALRYDKEHFEKQYFRELVKRTIPSITDEDIDVFYSTKHEIIWLKDGGYIGIQYVNGGIFIAYLFAETFRDKRQTVKTLKDTTVTYKIIDNADYFHNNSTKHNDDLMLML